MGTQNSSSGKNKKGTGGLFTLLLIVMSAFIFLMEILATIFRMPLDILLKKVYKNFYFHYHFVDLFLGRIGPYTLTTYIFFWFFLSLIFLVLILVARKYHLLSIEVPPFSQSTAMITFFILLFLMLTQTLQHIEIFSIQYQALYNKTAEERNYAIHKDSYRFSHQCTQNIFESHRGKLVSDLNFDESPGMGIQRKISYFLYPAVDIRNVGDDTKTDCLVIFEKANAHASVPPDFDVVCQYNENSLLAIRKK